MKKTTRLTALLIALVLLLANISASATETSEGIPLEDLDMETYSTMLTSAEDDPLNIGGTCGEDYCLYITETMVKMSAQEIYEYISKLYYEGLAEGEEGEEGPSDAYTKLMLHYGIYHQDLKLLCSCGEHPMAAPETFAVGALSVHEDDCPWKYENLKASDKVDVIEASDTIAEKQAYIALVTDTNEKAAMDAAAAAGEKIQLITDAENGTTIYLISSYGMETLATLETVVEEDGTEVQYLKDARYHIRVAKVVSGLVYPLN